MDQCEDREEGAPPPKTTDRTPPGPGPDRPLKAQRIHHRPESSGPDPGPGSSCASFRSDRSSMEPPDFSTETVEQQSSEVPSDPQHPTQLDSTCEETQMAAFKETLLKILEDLNDSDFKKVKLFLENEKPRIPVSKLEDADRIDTVRRMVQTYYTNTQKVTVRILKKMERTDLVKKLPEGILVCKESIDQCRRKLKDKLKRKFVRVFEGIVKAGHPKTLLNQIYTELYITEGGATEVNQEHEVRQIEKASRKLTVYGLSDEGFEGLSSVLRSQSSSLRHLALSTNDLEDSGLKILLASVGVYRCSFCSRSLVCMSCQCIKDLGKVRCLTLSYFNWLRSNMVYPGIGYTR
ncbi:uncharacterized protein LOC115426235 [Sphaeramia orbicularis]|uniref:uncharacterized protein LOC115426235 n=1 Tax=Sphaeramia orbicularis TaxID=375764 RepID=UPI00117CAFC1|nr:uncharacterized protein LOC115426235 [Sphaeramia orbicularis]